jgi:UDP:flavonoid glycosyltransferase YjiC (YdhE family)
MKGRQQNSASPILLFSEGISYCHVVRPLIIGRWLKELDQPILVACPRAHQQVFESEGYQTVPIETADPVAIYSRLAKGKTLYTANELLEYFTQDEQLIKDVSPRLIVADFRFPLLQLAKRAGIPSVGITSASCHPNFPLDGTTPNPFVRPSFIPPEFIDAIQKTFIGAVTRKLLVSDLSRPYRKASAKYGLPQLPTFFDYASQGDLCLLSDHPEIMPISQLRPQDFYTGALIWKRDDPLPAELDQLPADRNKVYITVGTQESMTLEFLDELLTRLLDEGHVVILSKGKRQFEIPVRNPRLFVFDFLNETKLLPLVDLYIYHGSAMSTYHGLYFGVPMISIPVQADQHFHSEALMRNGVGTLFRPVRLRISDVVATAQRQLEDSAVKEASKQIQTKLRSFSRREEILQRIGQLIG